MMHIYLCEDNSTQLEYWKKIIEKYLLMYDNEMELYCWTDTPTELLAYQDKSDSIGIYFLDVDLNAQMDGLQLADRIRYHDPRGYIIFITVHSETAPLTFQNKLEAMDFIIKDQPEHLENRIADCLQRAFENHKRYLSTSGKLLTIKTDGISLAMNQNDIFYITTGEIAHHLNICSLYGIRQITGSLKEFTASLDQNFCYCNRSTIINLDKVQEYRPKERTILMTNGKIFYASFRMAGDINKRLNKHGGIRKNRQ